jgi:two-component system sensor histidine kinase/response regulator
MSSTDFSMNGNTSPASDATGAQAVKELPGNNRAVLAHARHELRTPLNAIIGYSELLIEDEEDSGDTRYTAELRKISRSGHELLALVNTILDPEKIEEDQSSDIEDYEARIRVALRPLLAATIGYCERLLEDATRHGREDVVTELTKINLAANRLMILSENVSCISAPPSSSPTLPEVQAPDTADENAVITLPHPEAAEESSEPGEGSRLLVADDNEMNRDVLSRQLKRQGHWVQTAINGREALQLARAGSFDVILLDVMMPELNGYDTLRELKADPDLRHIPVIMISALDEMESIVRCIEMGAEDYLPKSFDPVLLKARIGASLEKKRLRDREIVLFQQLEENYKKLQELESLRDSLTHMVIHDLRTPLTSLLTGMQSLESLGELNEFQNEFVEIAISGGETLLSMINDLLDISKMEDGSLRLERLNIEADTVIETALRQVRQLAAEKNLTLEADISPQLGTIAVDEEKLRRALVNLLGNAVKFTPNNGKITLSAHPDGAEAVFKVADTGEGIPKESFQRIFEKFGQVENRKAGRKLSTGLGLTFCKMVAEAHGGRIWVESELGQGSTFIFAIPVKWESTE